MQRNETIDISKGISILLMTLTHLHFITKHDAVSQINHGYLVIFKMPLFIIISGFLYKEGRSSLTFFKRKFDGLIKPTISVILLFLLIGVGVATDPAKARVVEAFAFSHYHSMALWFVISLFISLIIFDFLIAQKSKSPLRFYAALFATVLMLSAFNYYNIKFFLVNLSTLIYFLVYLLIGYLIRRHNVLERLISLPAMILLLIAFATLPVVKTLLPVEMKLWSNAFQPFLLVLMYSCTGALLVLNIAHVIRRSALLGRLLTNCGKSSFFILSFHILIGNGILNPLALHLQIDHVFADIGMFVMVIAGCMALRRVFAFVPGLDYLFLPSKG